MCDSTTETIATDTITADSPDSGGLDLAPVQDSSCGCGTAKPAADLPEIAGSTNFDLQGLTCGSCVNKVEKLVAALDGVDSATVALVSGGTSVLNVSGSASPETVVAAVSEAGYPAAVSA